jgi:hypothetical protein
MVTGVLPSPSERSCLHREQSHDGAPLAMVDISGTSLNDTLPIDFNAIEHVQSPSITTVPGVDPPLAGRSTNYALRCARTLGNTTLLVTEIDELFRV